jgi:hypothetical protein
MDSNQEPQASCTSRELLRHALATVAYRGGKALRGAPEGFAEFRVAAGTRTPGEILAHISDLFDWALSLAEGTQRWHNSDPLPWDEGMKRFFTSLQAFDAYLDSDKPFACHAERLVQAPIADALTHIGQISLLRRLAGSPVRGENYFHAEIAAGRVGAEQAAPKMEFD